MNSILKIRCSTLLCSALFVSLNAFASEQQNHRTEQDTLQKVDLTSVDSQSDGENRSDEDSLHFDRSQPVSDQVRSGSLREPLLPKVNADSEFEDPKVEEKDRIALVAENNSPDGVIQNTVTDHDVLTELLAEIEQGRVTQADISAQNESSVREQSGYEPSVHDPSVHELSVYEKPVNDLSVHELSVHEKPANDLSVHELSVHEKPVNDLSVHELSVYEKPVKDPSVHEQTVHDPSGHEQIVHEKPVHEPLINGKNNQGYEDRELHAETSSGRDEDSESSISSSSSSSDNSSSGGKPLNKYSMTKVEYKIRKHKLEPLVDSDYWKNNQGSLPYSKCMITSVKGGWEQSYDEGLIVGGSRKKMAGQNVFCYSKKFRTAFMVPVKILKDKSVGATVTIPDYRMFRATVKKLNGKNLNRLFGKYSGFQGGIGFLLGASGAVLGNNGIAMYINSSGAEIFDLSLAYRKLNLEPRKLYSTEIYSPAFASRVNAVYRMISLINHNFSSQNDCYEELIAQQKKKLHDLKALDDSVKYHKMSRYWVHWLQQGADASSLGKELSSDSVKDLKFVKS